MRDYTPRDAADEETKHQLDETFFCYVDARDAWSEFIERDSTGNFLDEDNLVVKPLAERYGLKAEPVRFSEHLQFYKTTVLQAIWLKANLSIRSVTERLR